MKSSLLLKQLPDPDCSGRVPRRKLNYDLDTVNWESIQQDHDSGIVIEELCQKYGINRNWFTQAKREGRFVGRRRKNYERAASNFNWEDIQRYYDETHDPRKCCRHFGCTWLTFCFAVKTNKIKIIKRSLSPQDLDKRKLVAGTVAKHVLVKHGLPYVCARCGINHWNDQLLVLQIHHKNGNRFDHRKDNVILLCPNCHSQTDNFGGKKTPSSTFMKLVTQMVLEGRIIPVH